MISFIQRVIRAVCYRLRILRGILLYLLFRILPRRDKTESCVICERGTDARDNGYAFYRYMTENHPEIRVSYLITPDSADYHKVAENAVAWGSVDSYRVVAQADKIVSSHCYKALPDMPEEVWHMLGLHRKFYFLQHGIITAKLRFLFGNHTKMQMFCCAAVPEFIYVKENFCHPEGVVHCTGLARYDTLQPITGKRQILVMPTWRRYLLKETAFLQSDYYQAWNRLLSDKRLIQYLEETDTKLVFYPHYELQPYLKHFNFHSATVILADFAHFDVQQLLRESQLLITDYSSVIFDFAYMEKPCIHYQFDAEHYHHHHYKEGYFSFSQDGFGPVEKNHDTLVDQILLIAEGGFRMDEIYRRRADSFFLYRDQKNCERIYQTIFHQ